MAGKVFLNVYAKQNASQRNVNVRRQIEPAIAVAIKTCHVVIMNNKLIHYDKTIVTLLLAGPSRAYIYLCWLLSVVHCHLSV